MFPKKGNVFPRPLGPSAYRVAIATSLKDEVGDTHQAIEIVRRWTGASERTVKNWFAAKNAPAGEHLVALLRHSDGILDIPAAVGRTGAKLPAAPVNDPSSRRQSPAACASGNRGRVP